MYDSFNGRVIAHFNLVTKINKSDTIPAVIYQLKVDNINLEQGVKYVQSSQ